MQMQYCPFSPDLVPYKFSFLISILSVRFVNVDNNKKNGAAWYYIKKLFKMF